MGAPLVHTQECGPGRQPCGTEREGGGGGNGQFERLIDTGEKATAVRMCTSLCPGEGQSWRCDAGQFWSDSGN